MATPARLDTVAVIGNGIIGHGVAQVLARFVAYGLATRAAADAALGRIVTSSGEGAMFRARFSGVCVGGRFLRDILRAVRHLLGGAGPRRRVLLREHSIVNQPGLPTDEAPGRRFRTFPGALRLTWFRVALERFQTGRVSRKRGPLRPALALVIGATMGVAGIDASEIFAGNGVPRVVLLAGTCHAAELETASTDIAAKLLASKHVIQAFLDTAKADIITQKQAEDAIARVLKEASHVAGRNLTVGELLSLPEPAPIKLTTLQKAAGFMTFVNVLWVLAIGVGVLCIGYLAVAIWGPWLLRVLAVIPVAAYEALFYLFSAGLVVAGRLFADREVGQYVALTGCLLFAGALVFTGVMRQLKKLFPFFSVLFVVWTAVALYYESALIGFAAMAALMGALGFSVAAYGLCYCIGFKDRADLGRATTAGFLLIALFVGIRLLGTAVPYLPIFEKGALFMGSFVGYLGLLIASSRWYDTRLRYAVFQVVTVSAGVLALFLGSVWQIGELQKIAGTFFVLYLVEKVLEIPVKRKQHYAYLGLFVAGMIYGLAMFVRTHPDVIRPFLVYCCPGG